jgi:hypothetical protein
MVGYYGNQNNKVMETITLAGVKTQEELRTQVEVWLKTRQLLGHNIKWVQGTVVFDEIFNEYFVLYNTQTSEEYVCWEIDFEIENTGNFVRSIKYPIMEE